MVWWTEIETQWPILRRKLATRKVTDSAVLHLLQSHGHSSSIREDPESGSYLWRVTLAPPVTDVRPTRIGPNPAEVRLNLISEGCLTAIVLISSGGRKQLSFPDLQHPMLLIRPVGNANKSPGDRLNYADQWNGFIGQKGTDRLTSFHCPSMIGRSFILPLIEVISVCAISQKKQLTLNSKPPGAPSSDMQGREERHRLFAAQPRTRQGGLQPGLSQLKG